MLGTESGRSEEEEGRIEVGREREEQEEGGRERWKEGGFRPGRGIYFKKK